MEQIIDTKARIQEQAKNLFMKYGIRSVSMDDIAVGLGISKKTIYQWFRDKDELVDEIVEDDIKRIRQDCLYSRDNSSNAIEEVFLTMDRLLVHMQNMNPTILYDLRKFHFESFRKFMEHKNKNLKEVVASNLRRGMTEGLYRGDLDVEILSRYRLEAMLIPFDPDIFPSPQFNVIQVTMRLIENFLFGVVSREGYGFIEQYQQERTNKSKQK